MTGNVAVPEIEEPAKIPDSNRLSTECAVCGRDEWSFQFRRQSWDFVECDGCHLLRLDPVPTEQELADFYCERAAQGNYEFEKVSERAADLTRVLDFAERYCTARRRLFDIGCFDGGLLDLAAARGWEGWGLEFQADAASVAEQKHAGRVFAGTVEAFSPVRPGEFDLVTAIGLIEHLREPQRLFEVARDLLAPNGVLVIQTPNRRSVPARLLGRYWPPIAAPEHTHYFDTAALGQLCERFGMERVAARSHWKRLRIDYIIDQSQYFGPEFHRVLRPLVRLLPKAATSVKVPVYGGEVLFAAKLPSR